MADDIAFKQIFGCPEDRPMTVKDVLSGSMCRPPTLECRRNECAKCRDKEEALLENVLGVYEAYDIENVEFKKWTSTDRNNVSKI
jgi:hypothetical protein